MNVAGNNIVTQREWHWVIVVALAALLVSTTPLIAGYLAQTPDQRFAGALYDVQDYFSHLAKMQLGARGELAYRSLFTPEPHKSEPIILPYIVLGWAAARLGVALPVAYEVMRWLGGLALLLAAYGFIAEIIPTESTRRLAFVLAIVSSGLGWLVMRSAAFSYPHQSPMDFWLSDGYLLFSIMAFPHFGFSIAALLLSLIAWWRYIEQPTARRLALLVGLSTLHGFIQIFELPVLDAVIALDALVQIARNRRAFKPALWAALALAPVQAAMLWPYLNATWANPMMQTWSQQSRTLSPPPHYYLVGYGMVWVLVLLGLGWAWRQREERLILPALWIGAVAVLVYLPNNIQYRWLEGIQVPLAILAAVGLERVLAPATLRVLPGRIDPLRARRWITIGVVIATMPSMLYVIAGHALLGATRWQPAFLTGGQVTAIEWLGRNSQPDDVILSGLKVGGAIPARVGRRAFYGHWAETMYVDQKRQQVMAFFGDMADADRRSLVREYDVHFVFVGPDERKLGAFDPAQVGYMSAVFAAKDVVVYEVKSP